jgi:ComF family protein
MRDAILRSANGLLAILLAPPCAACGRPLESPVPSAVCDACWSGIRLLRPPFCGVCGDPLPSWRSVDPGHRCDVCRIRRPHIAAGRAIGDYDGSLRAIVHALKYDGRRSIATPLGALLRQHGEEIVSGADLVVPVPLHWTRHWRRGFNQAHELALGLGLPVKMVLRRSRRTRSQTGLSARARAANVRNAFTIRRHHSIHSLSIVLVDDVSTTGSTMEACARVLREGGAREVRTLTAARVATELPRTHPR